MAERSSSLTLPHNRPNEDKPASTVDSAPTGNLTECKWETATSLMAKQKSRQEDDQLLKSGPPGPTVITTEGAKVKVKVTADNDGADDSRTEDANATTQQAQVVQSSDVTSNEDTPTPARDAASINTAESRPRYKYSRPEEKKAFQIIAKAHAATDRDSVPELGEDKDVFKLTEMVSQMTHLLAASGMGRDTTARALAYINGPDKLTAKAAAIEAKRDRRSKKQRRASYGTVQSVGKGEAATDTKNQNNNTSIGPSDRDRTSSDSKAAPSTAVTSSSGKVANTDVIGDDDTQQSIKQQTNGTQATEALDTGKPDKVKKRFSRPKWSWGARRRNENKAKENEAGRDENKGGDGQVQTGGTTDPAKEPMVTTEEQKDQPDPSPVQVAPAA